jgi:ferric-dicitrate binding protein FerR (iron transport regulator)
MDTIKTLLQLYLRDELTEAQQQELQVWLNDSPENRVLLDELNNPDQLAVSFIKMDGWQRGDGLDRIRTYAATQKEVPFQRRLYIRWAGVAAAILVLLAGGGYWWLHRLPSVAGPVIVSTKPADVAAPVTNRATITLAGGRQIDLDSAGNGALVQQGSAQLIKQGNGQIAYKAASLGQGALLYNTLSNPRGSQVVHLTLADGTRVWLNAESSLRYPVVFAGSDRTVEITGEAYFEVAAEAHKPFKVLKGSTIVEVLGTAFNVNAYADEPVIKVTLLEGKLQVAKAGNHLLLGPGQQAVVAETVERSGTVDTSAVMAWKNGRFTFLRADLSTVLRELSRWYDVTVHYEGALPPHAFTGKFSKSLTLDQVLHILTNHHIHYTIEPNRQLTIRP